ncbi:hypothetical protein RvY_05039 [Ramazzottius varieornatus]|uniref:Uncharacterized protein n=1 Tax=Ramazzottius varieornatus TaxID=947166 RepID=A0A1D1V0D9_RAMVA|nr:hypothetical protein RvY_05039 [Ramazzottius varieornatus]
MEQNVRRRSREAGGKLGRKSYSSSKPTGSSRVEPSSISESALIDQNVLKSIPVVDLLSGFSEVKQKMSKFWTSFDKADNGQAVMDNLNTINFAVRTLQEIADAVMERDPHTAVYSQIFEDMWLFGFTRPSNICVKYEQSQLAQTDQTTLHSIRSWRRDFLANWTGFLYKLQDTFQIFRSPEKMLYLMPHQTQTMLPPRHPGLSHDASEEEDKHTAELKKRLYELPLTYLLRDIALCLARICGHENRELERVWIERAYRVNAGIAGSRYKDAWARLSDQLQGTTKAESPKNIRPSYSMFDYTADAAINQADDEVGYPFHGVDDTAISPAPQSNDVIEDTIGKPPVSFLEEALEDERSENLVAVNQKENGNGMEKLDEEHAEPKSFNMEFLERASGRNAFIQGLLERAADADPDLHKISEKKVESVH